MVKSPSRWSKTSSSINSMNPLQDRVFAKLFPKKLKLKLKIPKALRESVWISHSGKVFERACFTPWCQNRINVFDFHTGHNVPESKGGATTLDNLIPLCARCNLSMGNQYTFTEWSSKFGSSTPKKSLWKRFVGFFKRGQVSPRPI